jgi:hypothetical protein
VHDRNGWANGIPISFFRQIEYACAEFNLSNEYMLFITGDVKSEKWQDFFAYADDVLKLDIIGTLSPTLTNNAYQLSRHPPIFFEREFPLSIVFHNDLIVTYINKKIIEKLKSFFDYFNNQVDSFDPVVGWGIDNILRAFSHHLDLFNVRDRCFTFLHPFSSSYSGDEAVIEMEKIVAIGHRYFELNGIVEADSFEEQITNLSGKLQIKHIDLRLLNLESASN